MIRPLIKYALLLAIIGGGLAYYLWNKPHQNMEQAAVDTTLSAKDLFTAFDTDEQKANERYLDKVIQVSGVVTSSSQGEDGLTKISLESGDEMFGTICELDALSKHKRTQFTPGETITIKGKCTGKLMDVVLVRCVEI